MKFLSKLGAAALKFTQIAVGVAPVVSQAVPQSAGVVGAAVSEIGQLADIIQLVEVAGQAAGQKGPQKLTMAAPLVAQAVLRSSALAGKKIADDALFQKACAGIAGGFADLLNSLHPDGVRAEGHS